MHRAWAAANVLNMRLRDILREKLGGTYGVNVGYPNAASPPLGYGLMTVSVRQRAGVNVDHAAEGGARRGRRGSRRRARQPRTWPRCRRWSAATSRRPMRQNSYWAGSLQNLHLLGWGR